jgi:putative oxidoreductase
MSKRIISSLEPYTLSALRIIAGFCFSLHGVQKLFGWLGGIDGKGARAELFSMIGFAGWLEGLGGLLILLGLWTRPVAFIVSGQMAVAYFMAHAPRGFWPILNGGELAAVYCFLFLYLSAAGGGTLSVDRLLRGR